MLNYIWAGLIILSLVFALVTDVGELSRDRYRNGQPVPVTLVFTRGLRCRGAAAAGNGPDGQSGVGRTLRRPAWPWRRATPAS